MVKRSPAEKAPARKATKVTKAAKPGVAASTKSKIKKSTKPSKPALPAKKTPTKSVAPKKAAAAKRTAPAKAKTPARKPAPAPAKKQATKAVSKSKVVTAKPKSAKQAAPAPVRHVVKPPPPHVPRQPTRDEAAALKAFEKAHKEFVRGRFVEASSMFRALVEKHPGAAEVAARARTYLAVAESRVRRELSLPRDADSLYDRGVIELNRGDYVAAQEMFERALKREPQAAHIHYGLAATRARLGSIDSALESLQKALDLQPTLRVRAQHDHDLSTLRNDPVFEQLIFAPRI
jgi:tetratricopeptide (TPR) repeat protein